MTLLPLNDDEVAYLDLLHGDASDWAYRTLANPDSTPDDTITAKAIVHRCGPAPTWPEDDDRLMGLAGLCVVALTSGAVGACIGAAIAWAVTR